VKPAQPDFWPVRSLVCLKTPPGRVGEVTGRDGNYPTVQFDGFPRVTLHEAFMLRPATEDEIAARPKPIFIVPAIKPVEQATREIISAMSERIHADALIEMKSAEVDALRAEVRRLSEENAELRARLEGVSTRRLAKVG